ncbi:AraC family transcriptional regulator [Streptomyces sp. NPDC093252]|uniref:AraC family transcriptional regulator n=1 Tax=Streptomyces sp. NPDC093252 TaxID=3154980 RepID=UPI0034210DC2
MAPSRLDATVSAWRPPVPGVVEVFHAHFPAYTYPMHVHEAWTLLIVDDGAVRYDLERHRHGTPGDTVSLLPPHIPHNGSPATPGGFRKRVLYLDTSRLPEELIGAAVDGPDLRDPLLRRRVGQLHAALARPGEELEAESRLTFVAERLGALLQPRSAAVAASVAAVAADAPRTGPALARRLRELLDARVTEGVGLAEAGALLGAHPAHLVRAFSAAYAIAPHQYLTARRVERARALLLAGAGPAETASGTGFYDQAHLTRHFRRLVGVTPGRFQRSAR